MKSNDQTRVKRLGKNSNTAETGKLLPVLALLGAVLLWGSSFSAMRTALNSFSPFSVMFARLFVALLCILPFAVKLFPKDYQKGDWKILAPMVIFQPCLYFLFESNALTFTTSSQAGVISACLPLMVAMAAFLTLSEPISPKTITGLALSVVGVILLTIFQETSNQAPNPVLGNSLEILAMASACANIILIRSLSNRYNPWTLTFFQVLAGTLFFLPGARYFFSMDPGVWNFGLAFLLVYLGAFVSLLAFGLYNYGIARTSASRAGGFINLVPVVAVTMGWVFLDEILNFNQILAALAVITGVFLSNKK